jgi:hypothetical protein
LRLATGLTMAALLLAACTTTPPVPSPGASSSPTATASTATVSPVTTPTPTPTLDPDQTAALDVAQRYSDAMAKVRANPAKYDQYKMIDLLKPLAFDDMIQANLNGIRIWRNNGWHSEGSVVTVSTDASMASTIANGSTQVVITVCRDQRGLEVLDKKGKKVTNKAAQFPDFLKNTYDMRKPDSKTFRLWELAGEAVEGCEQ